VENSIYVRHDACGRGIGKALCELLVKSAIDSGYHTMVANIGDSQNTGSIQLHKSLGFGYKGSYDRVGRKFGRWLDVVHMQLILIPQEDMDAKMAEAEV
jgi:L-amino acid N-acyltransferase